MRFALTPSGGAIAALVLIVSSASSGILARTRSEPAQARIVVRTLVIDGLGTRTVDTNTAHVPFGSTGLLLRKVPYGGPPLSFRLFIRLETPRPDGIPLGMAADVWAGGIQAEGSVEAVSHRRASAIVADQTSYLLELYHEQGDALHGERRILLSIAVSPEDAQGVPAAPPPRSLRPVRFIMEIARREGARTKPFDKQILSGLFGHPVSYSWGVRSLDSKGRSPAKTGLNVTLTPETWTAGLMTVKVVVSGIDYLDEDHALVGSIDQVDRHTVRSGVQFQVTASPHAPADASILPGPGGDSGAKVAWILNVTPLFD
ncbi:MAG: hypothetical protein ACE5HU_09940 [Acidobacteriota bacterium]